MEKLMNKVNVLGAVVQGGTLRHKRRPDLLVGDESQGYIKGDLMDANAVSQLISDAVEQSSNNNTSDLGEGLQLISDNERASINNINNVVSGPIVRIEEGKEYEIGTGNVYLKDTTEISKSGLSSYYLSDHEDDQNIPEGTIDTFQSHIGGGNLSLTRNYIDSTDGSKTEQNRVSINAHAGIESFGNNIFFTAESGDIIDNDFSKIITKMYFDSVNAAFCIEIITTCAEGSTDANNGILYYKTVHSLNSKGRWNTTMTEYQQGVGWVESQPPKHVTFERD